VITRVVAAVFEKPLHRNYGKTEGRYHLGLVNIAEDDLRFDSIRTNALVLILAFKI